jgi:hypothetical protein
MANRENRILVLTATKEADSGAPAVPLEVTLQALNARILLAQPLNVAPTGTSETKAVF